MATINEKLDGNGQLYDVTKTANAEPSDRHTNSPAKTGQNIADKVYNIYDLEGNFYEFVAEKNTYNEDFPFVYRGGVSDGGYAASYRHGSIVGNVGGTNSFRFILYVM